MLFAVLFEDNPNADPDIRPRHMGEHLSFLSDHADTVHSAGPMIAEDGSPAGGLWLVDAVNREQVKALVETDPFWPTGLRRSVRILQWRQVFADGRRVEGA